MQSEALRYLGIQGEADKETLRLVSECFEMLDAAAAPKTIRRVYSPAAFSPFLVGKDIVRHLENCKEVILFAATLGMEVDRLIRKMQTVDMAKAAVLNACASAKIEKVCDEAMPERATTRFSPGYGDYPLSMQPLLLKELAAEKIGIVALESYMLLPTKSVTAVIGTGKEISCGKSKCATCAHITCAYRREDTK